MNEPERSELAQVKQQQTRLEKELASLSAQLALLEQRLSRPAPESSSASLAPKPIHFTREHSPASQPVPTAPPPIPPIIGKAPPLVLKRDLEQPVLERGSDGGQGRAPVFEPPPPTLGARVTQQARLKCACQGCGGHIEFAASRANDTILCPHCGQSTLLAAAARAGAPLLGSAGLPPAPAALPKPASSAKERSWEMRLGTYWFVRVGTVLVLTGLVFFGNLAYHSLISKLGPAGKVTLLYLASGILLGAGAFWQRKAAKASLRNYAQVLFAGGLAAVYFTTYAAHHIEQLSVIRSASLDGALLLAWAGFMVWIADRKKSEVLALFAVGLAYYSSIITHVGLFTLYSNLLLTLAAVFFLVRNRWAALSFGSLVATYAAYAFWRFFDGSNWHWASPAEGLWTGTYFLISYWIVFTVAVFLSRDEKFAGQNRAGFATVNNGAFFAMFLLTMLQVREGGFWKFSLLYGTGLLVLAEVARRVLAAEPLAKNSYLTQGLLLVTLGIISNPKLAGLQLALVLAAESIVLLMLGLQRKNLVLQTGAYIAAALAVGWGMDGMKPFDRSGLWLGSALGAFMVVNAVLVHRQTAAPGQSGFRSRPAYFTVLALLIWLVATWNNTSHADFPLVLAVEALVLTLSIYILRVPEVTLLGQSYVALAQVAWLGHYTLQAGQSPAWWNPLLMLFVTVFLSHWWQRQKALELRSQFALFCQGLYAFAVVALLYVWLNQKVEAPTWLALTSLLAVALTAYGVLTRAWWLAAFGQIFLAISSVQFFLQLAQARPHWPLPLAPVAALALLSFATVKWFQLRPDSSERISEPLLQLALVYRWVALGLSIWWVCEYIPERERIWLLALLGLWVFIWAGWQRSREALLFSGAYTAAALVLFWLPLLEAKVYWPNLVVILVLLAQRQFARQMPERYPLEPAVHGAVILTGGLSLWLFLSRWVLEQSGSFYLTASWAALALALFTAGMVLRERMYRWLGLGILACALGRILIFDVWKLEAIFRILSFTALGVVLLVLGFVYNKYQEKIREWL